MLKHRNFFIFLILFCYGMVLAEEPNPALDFTKSKADLMVDSFKKKVFDGYIGNSEKSLLSDKENVDSFFLPIFLLHELSDTSFLDYCRLFRFNYTSEKCFQTDVPKAIKAKIHKSLDCFKLQGNNQINYRIRMTRFAYTNSQYPVSITIRGFVRKREGAIYGQHYEPLLGNRELDFSIHPDSFKIRYNEDLRKLFDWSQEEPILVEKVDSDQEPIFDEIDGVYCIMSPFRIFPKLCDLGNFTTLIDEVDATTQAIYDSKHNILRSTNFIFSDNSLSKIIIDQNPIKLTHTSRNKFIITKSYSGGKIEKEEYLPTTTMKHLVGGRRIEIFFAPKAEYSIPKKLVVFKDKIKLFEAVFEEIVFQPENSDVDSWHDDEWIECRERSSCLYFAIHQYKNCDHSNCDHHDSRSSEYKGKYYTDMDIYDKDGNIFRNRLKYNIYLAIYRKDKKILDKYISKYKLMLNGQNYSHENYIYSLELFASMTYAFIGEDEGLYICNNYLKDAYAELDANQLKYHISRLVEQFRLGYALLAIESSRRNTTMDNYRVWLTKLEKTIKTIIEAECKNLELPSIPYLKEQIFENKFINENM